MQNEDAEELMRHVEKEEDHHALQSDKQCLHLCIINLVIGTLYCAKVGWGTMQGEYFAKVCQGAEAGNEGMRSRGGWHWGDGWLLTGPSRDVCHI